MNRGLTGEVVKYNFTKGGDRSKGKGDISMGMRSKVGNIKKGETSKNLPLFPTVNLCEKVKLSKEELIKWRNLAPE